MQMTMDESLAFLGETRRRNHDVTGHPRIAVGVPCAIAALIARMTAFTVTKSGAISQFRPAQWLAQLWLDRRRECNHCHRRRGGLCLLLCIAGWVDARRHPRVRARVL
jgi:hypothetical protein